MGDTFPAPFALPGFSGTIFDALSIIITGQYLDVASAALVTFEVLITLEQEIRLVWRGRWGFPTICYLATHYGVVIQALLNIVTALDSNVSLEGCLKWNMFSLWTVPLIIILVEAMLLLRITPLYKNDLRLLIPLLILAVCSAASACAVVGVILESAFPIASFLPGIMGCQFKGGSEDILWAAFIPPLVFETTVMILTFERAVFLRRRGNRLPLLTILVRDGFVYYVVVCGMMLTEFIICLVASPLYYSLILQPISSVSATLCSRLFLNLREAAYIEETENEFTTFSTEGDLELNPAVASIDLHEALFGDRPMLMPSSSERPVSLPSSSGGEGKRQRNRDSSFLEMEEV